MKAAIRIRGRKASKSGRARVDTAYATPGIVTVSAAQYKRLTAPDRPSEVPSALRDLVLQDRSAKIR